MSKLPSHLQNILGEVSREAAYIMEVNGYTSETEHIENAPEAVRVAQECLFLSRVFEDLWDRDAKKAHIVLYRLGIGLGVMMGARRYLKKYARTNREIVERIRYLFIEKRWSDERIALHFNDEGMQTNRNKPFKPSNIEKYRRDHNIKRKPTSQK